MAKGKGKAFEREISKDMSLWLTKGEDENCIWYTKSSGGRATRHRATRGESSKFDHGDLGPDGSKVEWFFNTFSIELKTGYGTKNRKSTTLWAIMDLIDSKQQNPLFHDFWYQAVNDAEMSEREPLLIFRRNRRLPCIAMKYHIFNAFTNHSPIEFDTIRVQFDSESSPIVTCNIRYFFDHTWGMVNPNFIKLRINRALMKYNKGIHNEG